MDMAGWEGGGFKTVFVKCLIRMGRHRTHASWRAALKSSAKKSWVRPAASLRPRLETSNARIW